MRMIYIKGRLYPDTGGYQIPPALPKEFAPKFKSRLSSIYELELGEILHEIDLKFLRLPIRRTVPVHLTNAKIDFERIICLRRYKICA